MTQRLKALQKALQAHKKVPTPETLLAGNKAVRAALSRVDLNPLIGRLFLHWHHAPDEVQEVSFGSRWVARPSPWGTCTSYSLPAFLAHSPSGQNEPCHSLRRNGSSTSVSGPKLAAISVKVHCLQLSGTDPRQPSTMHRASDNIAAGLPRLPRIVGNAETIRRGPNVPV